LCLTIQTLTFVNHEDQTDSEPVTDLNVTYYQYFTCRIANMVLKMKKICCTEKHVDVVKMKFQAHIDSFMMMCPIFLWEVAV
jgi:hypothetical protein